MTSVPQAIPQVPAQAAPNADGSGKTAPKSRSKRRGKGGKGSEKGSGTSGSSSISTSMRSISGGASVLFEPENTFYLVNVPAFLLFAFRFDSHMRSLSRRRPGHPQHFEYAAIIVFALLAKLCRVGISTAQLPLSAAEICDASWVLLPPVIAGVIGTFGTFKDINHVNVAPRVTRGLLTYLFRLTYSLCDENQGVRAAAANIANHQNYLHDCYGIEFRVQSIANHWVNNTASQSRFRCGGVAQDELRLAGALMLTEHAVRTNALLAPSAAVNFETYGLPGDSSAADCAAIFQAGAVAAMVNSIAQAAARHNNAAPPFGAAAQALVLNSVFPPNGTVNIYTCRASVQFITSLYDVVPVDFGSEGSCAPTVVLEQSGSGFTAASCAMCLTVQDAIVGCLIGNDHLYWTTYGGVIYSFHSVNQSVRVHTTPFSTSYDAFRVRAFQDGIRSGSY